MQDSYTPLGGKVETQNSEDVPRRSRFVPLLVILLVAGCITLLYIMFGASSSGLSVRGAHSESVDLAVCDRDTTGQCHIFSCAEWRNAECIDGSCMCREGECAHYGMCQSPHAETIGAKVVAVEQQQPRFPAPHNHLRNALCFSGGGSRSLALALGVFRALEDLNLMSSVDAISSVSGGTWASAIYMFSSMSKTELLGAPTNPRVLDMSTLSRDPPQLGRAAMASIDMALAFEVPVSDVWIDIVSSQILAPFGLGRRNTYMASSAEEAERIKKTNHLLRDAEFLTPQPNRPKVLVMNGALLAPHGEDATKDTVVGLQLSPDYSGSPFYPDGKSLSINGESVWVGGGFVETYAFGSEAPKENQDGGVDVKIQRPARPFSLSDAVGLGSAAFAAAVTAVSPQFLYWPVIPGHQEAQMFSMGDGGSIDDSGILAMLQRKVPKIVWSVNTDVKMSDSVDFCAFLKNGLPDGYDFSGKVTNQMYDKFGFGADAARGPHLSKNQVFSQKDFLPLVCALQSQKKDGRPAVHSASFMTVPNAWWGIEGGFEVDIIFIYNDICLDFQNLLPDDTKASLLEGNDFENFPNFKTAGQNGVLPSEMISLTPAQINLLAAQSEYFVRMNEPMFRKVLEVAKGDLD